MLVDFLKTDRTRADLATTLAVLREFKRCESWEEWLAVPFLAWVKLEQLEEYLNHLVNGSPLEEDTMRMINGDN